ncbi:40S ribosomal protein S30 [Platanthera guangdongensis]|uniref:40S ribosomal protein S30 n=1 Tax=Platanthera guangdongensis TaxID=2320717 RepID=A0ABR2MJ39_9ASPA
MEGSLSPGEWMSAKRMGSSSPWRVRIRVHGSLARAGKVRGQTPKVAKQDKKKKPRGRAHKRMQYNRRFVTAVVGFGKKRDRTRRRSRDLE